MNQLTACSSETCHLAFPFHLVLKNLACLLQAFPFRLAFRHLNTADDNGINLYSIAVRDMNVPVVEIEGPEETIAEIETYYTATLTFGAGDNINYIWSSTMNDAGLASMTTNSEQMSITYDTHGTDTIRVTVDNGYSTATATYTVTVAAAPCHTPTDLVTDTADTASVSFSWTPGRDEAEWEVTVGTTVVIVDEPHHTAEGLAADTTYLVLVRAICSEGDTSMALTGMVSTTAPEPGPGPCCKYGNHACYGYSSMQFI